MCIQCMSEESMGKKRLSPALIRHQKNQLARQIESGVISDKQAVKKMDGLLQRRGK